MIDLTKNEPMMPAVIYETGLDRFDLELMDEDERREALEDAGLDLDDYEF